MKRRPHLFYRYGWLFYSQADGHTERIARTSVANPLRGCLEPVLFCACPLCRDMLRWRVLGHQARGAR